MASPESNKESGKSDLQKPDAQQLDGTTFSSNDSINQENEVDSVVNAEKKENSTSDEVNECASIQEKNTDNVETVQNELNDVETKKDENVHVSQIQEIKTDKKDIAVKEESALKRKRKPLRLLMFFNREEICVSCIKQENAQKRVLIFAAFRRMNVLRLRRMKPDLREKNETALNMTNFVGDVTRKVSMFTALPVLARGIVNVSAVCRHRWTNGYAENARPS